MKILKEAVADYNDIVTDYDAKFTDLLAQSDFVGIVDLIKKYGPQQLKINATVWDKFVDVNYGTLIPEFKQYGFSRNNPYVKFIFIYNGVNNNLDAFSTSDKYYNELHKLVGDRVLETKQLDFTATEDERIPILTNKDLYTKSISDMDFLIKTEVWFVDNIKGLDDYITNKNIKTAFSSSNNGKLNPNDIVRIRKALLFTNLLNEVSKSENPKSVDLSSIDSIKEYEAAFQDPAFIEEQLKLLHTGVEPFAKTEDNKNEKIKTNISAKEVNRALSNANNYNLTQSLRELSTKLSPGDWKQFFNSLSNMYDIIGNIR